jgi:hypothetical protein
LLIVGTVIAIAALGYIGYAKRFQIEAMIWHWRHGYSTSVGEYEVPVPRQWMVWLDNDPNSVSLIDTRIRRRSGLLSAASLVDVHSLDRPFHDLSSWQSFERQTIERQGLTVVEERTLRVDDETVVCLGDYELGRILKVPNVSVVSVECVSTGRLHLAFFGPQAGLADFYAIASHIRKREPR